MKRTLGKVVAFALIATSVLSNTGVAFATNNDLEINTKGDFGGNVPSEFTIESKVVQDPPPLFNSGIVVDLPASIEMEHNKSLYTYSGSDKVGVRGDVSDLVNVTISVANSVNYTIEDGSNNIEAKVEYGETLPSDETRLAAMWTAADLKKGFDDENETIYQDVSVSLQSIWDAAGDYSAELEFNVSVNDVMEAEAWELVDKQTVNNKCGMNITNGIVDVVGSAFANFTGEEEANMLNLVNVMDGIESQYKNFIYSIDPFENDKVKTIRLYVGNYMYGNTGSIDDFRGCLKGLIGLECVIVPEGITASNLRNNIKSVFIDDKGRLSVSTGAYQFPPEHKWSDADILMGDALFFVTDLNDDGTWRYVPNIIYEGTIEQWKSLSYYGNVDGKEWFFANAGNDVYVYCTDGVLKY